MATIAALLREASSEIGSESARIDAELLLGFVLEKNSAWFIAHGDDELPPAMQAEFLELLQRRKAGEPVAHHRITRVLDARFGSHCRYPDPAAGNGTVGRVGDFEIFAR